MGFSFTTNKNTTKREYIAQAILREFRSGNDYGSRVVDHAVVGDIVYTLCESWAESEKSTKWIGVHRLEKAQGCWGHKSMDETMGPYHYNCPLRILNAASATSNKDAQEWRETCRERHAHKARLRKTPPTPGDRWVVDVGGGPSVVSVVDKTQYNVKRGVVARDRTGTLYRYKKAQFQYQVFA